MQTHTYTHTHTFSLSLTHRPHTHKIISIAIFLVIDVTLCKIAGLIELYSCITLSVTFSIFQGDISIKPVKLKVILIKIVPG